MKLFLDVYNHLRFIILPLREIDQFSPKKGRIIDLGCGEGVVAKYLARNKRRFVIGVDQDEKRLQKSSVKNLKFVLEDIRNFKIENATGVILSDVLHHLKFSDQKKILNNISQGFKNGSVLIIKEIDFDENIRSKLSRFWDFVFYPKDKIYYSSAKKLTKILLGLNFKVQIIRASRFIPGSTTLFICTKC